MVLLSSIQFIDLLKYKLLVIQQSEVPYELEDMRDKEVSRINDLIAFHSNKENEPKKELTEPYFLSAN